MGLAEIKAEIKTVIVAVDGIAAANVHTRMRWDPDWDKMYEFFKEGGDDGTLAVINGWIIETVNTPRADWKTMRHDKVYRDWTFRILGMYSLLDPENSADILEPLFEAVMNELDKMANVTFGGTAWGSQPSKLIENVLVSFGATSVHRCEIQKVIQTITNPNT